MPGLVDFPDKAPFFNRFFTGTIGFMASDFPFDKRLQVFTA